MKVYIKTYGCQMNERDSESAAAVLKARGHEIIEQEDSADVLIYNTCSVRDQAERKAVGKIGIMKRLKKLRPEIVIGVMGCMAQSRGAELLEKIPHLDFALGTDQTHRLPDAIEEALAGRRKKLAVEHDDSILTTLRDCHDLTRGKFSAFMAVMRGCSRFCSYCIVPHVRGREKSRPAADILDEARKLAASGVREIMLLGQNIAAYGMDNSKPPAPSDKSPFAELLRALNGVDGIERIRFTSPHPAYFNESLVDAIAELPKVCDSAHLPLQSGSDRILKMMNRPYTASQYMRIVDSLKAKLPGVTFSTDVIVGFPSETDADFEETRRVMNEAGFDNAFIFKYSKRAGTPAADMPGQVAEEIKEERNQILLKDLEERTARHNAGYVGRVVKVLAEGPSKRNSSRWAGRTSCNKVVIFDPREGLAPGDFADVRITRSTAVSLFGAIEKKD